MNSNEKWKLKMAISIMGFSWLLADTLRSNQSCSSEACKYFLWLWAVFHFCISYRLSLCLNWVTFQALKLWTVRETPTCTVSSGGQCEHQSQCSKDEVQFSFKMNKYMHHTQGSSLPCLCRLHYLWGIYNADVTEGCLQYSSLENFSFLLNVREILDMAFKKIANCGLISLLNDATEMHLVLWCK